MPEEALMYVYDASSIHAYPSRWEVGYTLDKSPIHHRATHQSDIDQSRTGRKSAHRTFLGGYFVSQCNWSENWGLQLWPGRSENRDKEPSTFTPINPTCLPLDMNSMNTQGDYANFTLKGSSPNLGIKPGTVLLWGDRAHHCTAQALYSLTTVMYINDIHL